MHAILATRANPETVVSCLNYRHRRQPACGVFVQLTRISKPLPQQSTKKSHAANGFEENNRRIP
jgi:hypothetical protein